jgi:hypothetical protein
VRFTSKRLNQIELALLLTDLHQVPPYVIKSWNDRAYARALKWAVHTHLAASDNSVRVPPMPAFLQPWETKPGETSWLIGQKGHPQHPEVDV